MANPPPMLPGLGFPVDSEIDLLRKWTWNTWLWAQEDFQPSDIPGLGLWLDAYSLNDTYGYLDSIPAWPDLSGNGRNATQAIGAYQPRFLPWHSINYFHLPNVAGNFVRITLPDDTYDFVVTYEDGTTAAGTKATSSGNWDFGAGDSDFYGRQVRRVQLSIGGVAVADLWADDGNANSMTIPDRISGTWTINRSGANPARIVSAPAVLFDGTDDYLQLTTGLDLARNRPGITIFAVISLTKTGAANQIFSAGAGNNNIRATLSRNATNNIFAGGRRLNSDSFQSTSYGPDTSQDFRILSARLNWQSAVADLFIDGSVVSTLSPFQSSGNSENSDSPAIRVGASPNTPLAPIDYTAGAMESVNVYQRALTDAEILQLSRYLAARANAGIVI